MYRITLFFLIFLAPVASSAHQPVFPEPESSSDYVEINEPDISHAFYGTLTGYPHTYQLVVTADESPVTLFAEVLVPDREDVTNDRSVIIVKEAQHGVSEVARLRAREAGWESFFEPFGADRYRRGDSYETELDTGVYLIEVSTPENQGPYVLVVGKREAFSIFDYPQLIVDMYRVKHWYGKSGWLVLQSPLVYVPLVLIVLVWGFIWYRRRYA
ncbi:hypothetical protein KDA23_02805 [Candidatus Saccharibacteria bacterium]|nr:hypothetical protein [Candidatus Saccharibacteria bacterium]